MSIKLAPFEVYKAYNDEILKFISITGRLSVDSVIELSHKLYTSIQVKDVDYSEVENDMLLFQYGTYNWGDDKGEHATFDITRQIEDLSPHIFNHHHVFRPAKRYNTFAQVSTR
ncbi:hypothetical protein [Niastella populi]|uniref:Uncharacterized protein n=1 Tax=Niastella populi TaxID=550983 RepID=A0A1V9F0W3_9BACT|nr:hypothetical protein [Niastella populi]OQP51896.1 hypothetical protein A4R26_29195 [Niastella populi]